MINRIITACVLFFAAALVHSPLAIAKKKKPDLVKSCPKGGTIVVDNDGRALYCLADPDKKYRRDKKGRIRKSDVDKGWKAPEKASMPNLMDTTSMEEKTAKEMEEQGPCPQAMVKRIKTADGSHTEKFDAYEAMYKVERINSCRNMILDAMRDNLDWKIGDRTRFFDENIAGRAARKTHLLDPDRTLKNYGEFLKKSRTRLFDLGVEISRVPPPKKLGDEPRYPHYRSIHVEVDRIIRDERRSHEDVIKAFAKMSAVAEFFIQVARVAQKIMIKTAGGLVFVFSGGSVMAQCLLESGLETAAEAVEQGKLGGEEVTVVSVSEDFLGKVAFNCSTGLLLKGGADLLKKGAGFVVKTGGRVTKAVGNKMKDVGKTMRPYYKETGGKVYVAGSKVSEAGSKVMKAGDEIMDTTVTNTGTIGAATAKAGAEATAKVGGVMVGVCETVDAALGRIADKSRKGARWLKEKIDGVIGFVSRVLTRREVADFVPEFVRAMTNRGADAWMDAWADGFSERIHSVCQETRCQLPIKSFLKGAGRCLVRAAKEALPGANVKGIQAVFAEAINQALLGLSALKAAFRGLIDKHAGAWPVLKRLETVVSSTIDEGRETFRREAQNCPTKLTSNIEGTLGNVVDCIVGAATNAAKAGGVAGVRAALAEAIGVFESGLKAGLVAISRFIEKYGEKATPLAALGQLGTLLVSGKLSSFVVKARKCPPALTDFSSQSVSKVTECILFAAKSAIKN